MAKITVEKGKFLNAIKAVKTACEKGKLQPVLNAIHIESVSGGLQLTATDCNNIAKAVIEANTEEKIDICINADRLESIVARLDKLITLEVEGANVIIKSGKTKFNSLFISGDEFPKNADVIEIDEENKIILKKEDLINAINKTVYATAQDTTGNVIISGVCLTLNKGNGYELAATDGNRLSQVVVNETKGINKEGQFVISKKILLDVSKVIEDEVEISFINANKSVSFRTVNYLFSSRLLNGNYPPYQQLIPDKQPNIAKVNKNDLLKAIDNVSIMANDKTNIITLLFTENELKLECHCQDGEANDNVEIDNYSGEELKMALNYKFLLEGIRAITTDELTFKMNTSLSPCLIESDFNYLIMPIQIR